MLGASLRNILLYIVLGVFAFNVCTMHVAEARTETCESYPDKSCGPGCYYSDASNGCERCPEGTYKSEVGSGPCSACTKNIKIINGITVEGSCISNYMTGDAYTGYTSNTCPLAVRCSPGYYWKYDKSAKKAKCLPCSLGPNPASNAESQPAVEGCYKTDVCGDNKTVNIKKCDVIVNRLAEGVSVDVTSNFDSACVPNIYKLKLNKNTNIRSLNSSYPGYEIEYENKDIYVKCNTGFAGTEDATDSDWTKQLPREFMQPTYGFKYLLGYSYYKDSCTDIVISKDGWVEYDNDYNSTNRTLNIFNKDTELYACWINREISVTYYKDGESSNGETIKCTLSDGSADLPEECLFPYFYELDKEGTLLETGSVFDYYDCRMGLNHDYCLGEPKEFGQYVSIPFVSTSLQVLVKGKECPAGYYCSSVQQNSCPVGTTSGTKSTSVSACYMPSGQSGTKFCDKNGCFYLPTGIGNISYNPS